MNIKGGARVPMPPAGADALAKVLLLGDAAVYAATNSLYNVEGGHRAIVFNRIQGSRDKADEEAHGDVVTSGEISSPPDVLGKTVRVRFVLKKQCAFGKSFHLVGEDPALVLWDPSKAVALDWSEGHDWTVEKDLPANRLIEFKFLLQDSSGKFH